MTKPQRNRWADSYAIWPAILALYILGSIGIHLLVRFAIALAFYFFLIGLAWLIERKNKNITNTDQQKE